MSYNLTTVTNAGNKLFNTIIDDNTRLVLDRIEVSATQLDSSTNLKSMTAIDSVVQTLPVNGVSKGDTSIIVKTVLDNKDIKTDYKAWVFGIWGHDEVANVDTLVGVITTTATPDTVPAFDPGSTIGLKYSFGIVYSNTAEITIKQVNDQYAINDDVVHISGDESVTGTKTFQTIKIDNDSAKDVVTTDGYNISLDNGNSKFVPADDAKVVHTADMRKPASDVAGIEEVNAGLSTKVADNKNGTEQLNGVQVQPFNKLSDTIGGRNLLIGTSDFTGWTLGGNTAQGTTDGLTYAHLYDNISVVAPDFTLAESTTYTVSFDALGLSAGTASIYIGYSKDSKGNIIASDYVNATLNALDGASVRVSLTFTTPSSFTKTNFNIGCGHSYTPGGSVYIRHVKLEKGSIATDWTPAPEDKVEYIRASSESDAVAKSKADPNNLYYWV